MESEINKKTNGFSAHDDEKSGFQSKPIYVSWK